MEENLNSNLPAKRFLGTIVWNRDGTLLRIDAPNYLQPILRLMAIVQILDAHKRALEIFKEMVHDFYANKRSK